VRGDPLEPIGLHGYRPPRPAARAGMPAAPVGME
jgi:hypothetical protein